jgi:hypothetical protein
MNHEKVSGNGHWLSMRGKTVLIVFVTIVALLFFMGQVRLLPFLLLLACPFMHMLMHLGHGKHRNGSQEHH